MGYETIVFLSESQSAIFEVLEFNPIRSNSIQFPTLSLKIAVP